MEQEIKGLKQSIVDCCEKSATPQWCIVILKAIIAILTGVLAWYAYCSFEGINEQNKHLSDQVKILEDSYTYNYIINRCAVKLTISKLNERESIYFHGNDFGKQRKFRSSGRIMDFCFHIKIINLPEAYHELVEVVILANNKMFKTSKLQIDKTPIDDISSKFKSLFNNDLTIDINNKYFVVLVNFENKKEKKHTEDEKENGKKNYFFDLFKF